MNNDLSLQRPNSRPQSPTRATERGWIHPREEILFKQIEKQAAMNDKLATAVQQQTTAFQTALQQMCTLIQPQINNSGKQLSTTSGNLEISQFGNKTPVQSSPKISKRKLKRACEISWESLDLELAHEKPDLFAGLLGSSVLANGNLYALPKQVRFVDHRHIGDLTIGTSHRSYPGNLRTSYQIANRSPKWIKDHHEMIDEYIERNMSRKKFDVMCHIYLASFQHIISRIDKCNDKVLREYIRSIQEAGSNARQIKSLSKTYFARFHQLLSK